MSEATIYQKLINAGLTEEGACALMGNLSIESQGLVPFIVQGDTKDPEHLYSKQYTLDVDNGRINKHDFVYNGPNGGGYGLAQWTYNTRKSNLYDFAVRQRLSIGDEGMQIDFCLQEFPSEAPETFNMLKTSHDMAKCVEWVCKWYERPKVNNIDKRLEEAQKFFNKRATYGTSVPVTPVTQNGVVTVPEDEYKRLTIAATVLDLMLNIQALVEDYKR